MENINWAKRCMDMALRLKLPMDAVDALQQQCGQIGWKELEEDIINLSYQEKAETAYKNVSGRAESDKDGMYMLAVMMAAASCSLERYEELGISEQIFDDTMGCFARFIEETRAKEGKLCFDRGFWTWRQLGLMLFRLGVLEFEYCPKSVVTLPEYIPAGSPMISVHIPSDASLHAQELSDSYKKMKELFAQKEKSLCLAGAPKGTYCMTWLLSPTLNSLLPESSGIKSFAADYEIYNANLDDKGFYYWLFGGCEELDKLPEKTSLQRKVKSYLAQGGKIGEASGILHI